MNERICSHPLGKWQLKTSVGKWCLATEGATTSVGHETQTSWSDGGFAFLATTHLQLDTKCCIFTFTKIWCRSLENLLRVYLECTVFFKYHRTKKGKYISNLIQLFWDVLKIKNGQHRSIEARPIWGGNLVFNHLLEPLAAVWMRRRNKSAKKMKNKQSSQ